MRPLVPYLNIKIDGSQLPKDALNDLIECSVDASLHLPDLCTIRLEDNKWQWTDSDLFKEGNKVQIQGGIEGQAMVDLFSGEVTALEFDLASHGTPTITIRCLSPLHRLHRGRQQRSFVQVSDDDVVKKVAGELGLSVEADSPGIVRDWVFQNNQTNWEFLQMLAGRSGYRLFLKAPETLCFKQISGPDDTIEVKWGDELRSFRPRLSASLQVDTVIVQGWDTKMKQSISERATQANGVPETSEPKQGGAIAKTAYGSASMVIVDRPIHDSAEATSLAKSICDEMGGGYLEADGLCFATPKLRPGMAIKVSNVGKRFSGTYFVTSTTHTYTPAEGLVTQFSVSGKRPTGSGLLDRKDLTSRQPLGGNVVCAVVTNNQDPDNQGRIKVRYPWLSAEHESFWVRLVSPMAGPGRGIEFLPEVEDEVLVAFEHGDIHRPYIIGALWNGVDQPVEPNSKAVTDGKVQRRTIKTRIGHFVLLDDTDGKGEISFTTCAGHTIVLDDAKEQILIQDKTGNNKITIKSPDNSITIECKGDMTLTADGNITQQCKGDFTVTAQGSVSISGNKGFEARTPQSASLKGDQGVTVKSDSAVTISGSTTSINPPGG